VKRSTELVALLPAAVTTVTCTEPAVPAGETAVMLVEEFTVTLIAAAVPKFTEDALVKLVRIMVTEVPPAVGPLAGPMPNTVGAEAYAVMV
jgi:hypothetical protein